MAALTSRITETEKLKAENEHLRLKYTAVLNKLLVASMDIAALTLTVEILSALVKDTE